MVPPCDLCALCGEDYPLISTETVGFSDNALNPSYRLSPDVGKFFDLSQRYGARVGNNKRERSALEGKNYLARGKRVNQHSD